MFGVYCRKPRLRGLVAPKETGVRTFSNHHKAVVYARKLLKKCLMNRKNMVIVEEIRRIGTDNRKALYAVERPFNEREVYFYDKSGRLVHDTTHKIKLKHERVALTIPPFVHCTKVSYNERRKYLKKVI
jgi:hypothetical protein